MAYLFYSTLTAIIPAIFVLLLGYSAGRDKRFDADQVKGINELVLNFALPAALFVGIVGTSRARIYALFIFRFSIPGLLKMVFHQSKMMFILFNLVDSSSVYK